MPNYCRCTLTIIGPREDRDAFLVRAGERLDFNVWRPMPDDIDREKAIEWREKYWGTKQNAIIPYGMDQCPRFQLDDDCIKCEFNTERTHPTPIIKSISDMFDHLNIRLDYDEDELWNAGVLEYTKGQCIEREHRVGWFRFAQDGEPVHHRVSSFDPSDPNVRKLIDSGTLFHTDTAPESPWYAFRCRPAELGVSHGLPNDETINYTLDEDIYLSFCLDRAVEIGVAGDLDKGGFGKCACPIDLTEQEAIWLSEQPPAEGQHGIRRIISALSGLATAAQWRPITTRIELAQLLECPALSDGRREEILLAMHHPRWTHSWPRLRASALKLKKIISTPRMK